MKILDQLYYGNINPSEHSFAGSREVQQLAHKITEYETTLIAGLTEEQKKLFRNFDDCVTRINEIEKRFFFRTGFRLGARITAEAYTKET